MKPHFKEFRLGLVGIVGLITTTTLPLMAADTSANDTQTPAGPPHALYLKSSYHGKISAHETLLIKSHGRVYDSEDNYVGHLTTPSGDRLTSVPTSGDYQIRTRTGRVIGTSDESASGIDSSRSITLRRAASTKTVASNSNPPKNSPAHLEKRDPALAANGGGATTTGVNSSSPNSSATTPNSEGRLEGRDPANGASTSPSDPNSVATPNATPGQQPLNGPSHLESQPTNSSSSGN